MISKKDTLDQKIEAAGDYADTLSKNGSKELAPEHVALERLRIALGLKSDTPEPEDLEQKTLDEKNAAELRGIIESTHDKLFPPDKKDKI